MEQYKVLVVDDHPLMRKALVSMIEDEPDLLLVGEAANGATAVSLTRILKPDVVIMDLFMPVKDGITATQELIAENPEIHILALTSSTEDEPLMAAVKAGVLGYIMKDAQPTELLHGIRAVAQGKEYWPPIVAARLVEGMRQNHHPAEDLSRREEEVLNLLSEGLSNTQIAQRMNISSATARAHVYHILRKLGLENRTQAALHFKAHKKPKDS